MKGIWVRTTTICYACSVWFARLVLTMFLFHSLSGEHCSSSELQDPNLPPRWCLTTWRTGWATPCLTIWSGWRTRPRLTTTDCAVRWLRTSLAAAVQQLCLKASVCSHAASSRRTLCHTLCCKVTHTADGTRGKRGLEVRTTFLFTMHNSKITFVSFSFKDYFF